MKAEDDDAPVLRGPSASAQGPCLRPIFLLTDFGAGSLYAGVMHAAILRRAPDARVVDLAHDITPGAIAEAGAALEAAWPHLPEACVISLVVDPGVGTGRGILLMACGDRTVLAPDNGVLSQWLVEGSQKPYDQLCALHVAAVDPEGDAAPTFHGRDLFAPAAALCGVVDRAWPARLAEQAPLVPKALGGVLPASRQGEVVGCVVSVDRFGNLLSNLRVQADLAPVEAGRGVFVLDESHTVSCLGATFGDVPEGEAIAYPGSGGCWELALRNGSAAEHFGVGSGASFVWRGGAASRP